MPSPVPPPVRGEERGRTWNTDRPGPRRFHAFYVGLPKTGSTTVAELFRPFRSGHEYRFEATAELLSAEADLPTLRAFLAARDAEGRLEMDAATFHHFYLPLLVELFPEAHFVVALRAPRPWLDSILNLMVRNRRRYGAGEVPAWQVRLGRRMFGSYAPEAFVSEDALRAALPGLVDRYLDFWAERTTATLAALPPDRSLVLRTEALSDAIPTLADFVGVPPDALDRTAHHQNRGPDLLPITTWMDPDRLQARVVEACDRISTGSWGIRLLG